MMQSALSVTEMPFMTNAFDQFKLQTQTKSLVRFYQEFWDRIDGRGGSGEADLSLVEARLLKFVRSQGPVRMCDISQNLNYPTSTLTYMVDRLVKRGYLERKRDHEDRRAIRLTLTDKAEDYLSKRVNQASEICQEAIQRLDDLERRQLSNLLGKIVAAL